MPGRSQEHLAAHVYSLECCPTNETLARTSLGYSTAACSPVSVQELAEPGTVGCNHNQQTLITLQRRNLHHMISYAIMYLTSDAH